MSTFILADENYARLTTNILLSDGYKKMSGEKISKKLVGPTLLILDLLAGSEYEVKLSSSGKSKLKKIKEDKPGSLTSADYHSRATVLTGQVSFSIAGDNIVTTDGIRSYSSTLYQKDSVILGVRDIDNGFVNFQIKIK